LSPKDASNNAQQFANDASKTATQVKQVAAYLKEKSKRCRFTIKKTRIN